ncbi:carbohydrate binding domain-containing protein [Paenibacillus sp. MSJ-34]|uniref:carbohydrate binding domain-containing protein n=1 Tax=Paenibacillus sp. MSJ-34 TaxID=2841529 RepID=UPI001C101722|nr:carbohydrate binding domain-containing protein [Paenibacillus sp. MSJ-34]MBU5445552.1 carbohydrate binding domain-containing protein [Paenibacillus sp. MSJ-34]
MKKGFLLCVFFLCSIMLLNPIRVYSTDYLYDSSNRMKSIILPEGNQMRMFYDEDGNLIKKIRDDNMFRNGNFESYETNAEVASHWRRWESVGAQGEYKVVQSPYYSGGMSQKIEARKIPNGAMNIYQDVNIKPNEHYTINGRLLIERMKNANFIVAIHYFDSQFNLIKGETVFQYEDPTSWLTFTGEMTTPSNASIARIHFHLQELSDNGYGTIYLDSVKMTKGKAENLFYNPSFEFVNSYGDVASGWSVWKSEGSEGEIKTTDRFYKTGFHSQAIHAHRIPQGGMNFFQDLYVEHGKTYRISSDIKITHLSNAAFVIAIHYFDEKYNLVGGTSPVNMQNTIDWTEVKAEITPPKNTKIARIHFHVTETGDGGNGEVYIDNAVIAPIT